MRDSLFRIAIVLLFVGHPLMGASINEVTERAGETKATIESNDPLAPSEEALEALDELDAYSEAPSDPDSETVEEDVVDYTDAAFSILGTEDLEALVEKVEAATRSLKDEERALGRPLQVQATVAEIVTAEGRRAIHEEVVGALDQWADLEEFYAERRRKLDHVGSEAAARRAIVLKARGWILDFLDEFSGPLAVSTKGTAIHAELVEISELGIKMNGALGDLVAISEKLSSQYEEHEATARVNLEYLQGLSVVPDE